MNRSLLSGLSGTLANQAYIDVLGNNIANANTIGFKQGRIVFQDAYYQTMRGTRAGASVGLGGQDPAQVGSGVSVAQIQVLHTQGAMRYTGAPLDVAVEGRGMFLLHDGVNNFYTRDGSFTLDSTNSLVSGGSGLRVLGWMAQQGTINTAAPPSGLSFQGGTTRPGSATTAAVVGGNLDANLATGDQQTASISVYDALGFTHQVALTFTRTANANEWTCEAQLGGATASGTLTFDGASGALTAGGSLTLTAPVTTGAVSPLSFDLDLAGVSQLAQTDSRVMVLAQDGSGASTLTDVSIIDGGLVQGQFSDGHLEVLGQLAVACFDNPGGLVQAGNNLYQAGTNAGRVDIGPAGMASRGQVRARRLEMSNVDLTQSFVEIMTAQRGFQANTRVISAANRMMEDVLQLNVG